MREFDSPRCLRNVLTAAPHCGIVDQHHESTTTMKSALFGSTVIVLTCTLIITGFGVGVLWLADEHVEIVPARKTTAPPAPPLAAAPRCSFPGRATLETLGGKNPTLLFVQPLRVHNPTDRPVRLALWCQIVSGPSSAAETREERTVKLLPHETRDEAVWISWRNVFMGKLQHRYRYRCGCREVKPPAPAPPGQGVLTSSTVPTP